MKRFRLTQALTTIVTVTLLLGACGRRPMPSPTTAPLTPTSPPAEAAQPVVIQRTPEPGEELGLDSPIEIIFDRAMDQSSVQSAFEISPKVDGNFDWVDERTVRFSPTKSLERDERYAVVISEDARASDGNSIGGAFRFRFRTVGYLEVAQVIPAPSTEDVAVQGSITVIFNRPVVPLTAVSDPAFDTLPDPLAFDPPVEGHGEWLNTSIYMFVPDDQLIGGTTYTVRVPQGLTDATGGVLATTYEWSFTTQRPDIVWVSPREDADLISVDTAIKVTFNMPIDPVSARSAFKVRTGGQTLEGTTQINRDKLVFTPTESLPFDTDIHVQVDKGVRSIHGGQGMAEGYEWSFQTVPLPRILRTTPRDGERDAWSYTDFQIEFNAPIDPSTVLPNLRMTPPLSPAQVYTYYNTWNNVFVLDFGAEPSTDYAIEIAPNIQDPYGNATGQEMTVRFRTADLAPWVFLNIPGMVGTLDADQNAQVVVGYLNTTRVDLSMFQLDTADFFTAQNDWWSFTPVGTPMRTWSIGVDAPLNETRQIPVNLSDDEGPLEPGIYLLQIQAPGVEYDGWRHRRLLIVSEYNVTIKTNQDEMWAWVTNLADGQPAPDVKLNLLDDQGQNQGSGQTDRMGLASFQRERGSTHYVVSDAPFILAGSTNEWSSGISPWDFGLDRGHSTTDFRSHIYTDRPIYRPEQIVYFKGIVRAEDDARYTLPGPRVKVTIVDPERETIYEKDLPLDEFGAFYDEISLPASASLGSYAIFADVQDQWSSQYAFQVAAYRPPEFEVQVRPEASELTQGQGAEASIDVDYFFGGAVADVEVEWHVLSTPFTFQPSQFGRYTFSDTDTPWICRWCWQWQQPQPEVVFGGAGVSDASGSLRVELPGEIMTGSQRLTLEATTYGKDGQTISGRSDIIVHPAGFYVGLAAQQYLGKAGEDVSVDVVTVDWEGTRLPGKELDVQVFRREWINTFVEGENGTGKWEWEAFDSTVYTGTVALDGQAEGVLTFRPEEGGSYHVVVSGPDGLGHQARSSIWIWVSGSDYVSWRRQNNDRITLISDKATYAPGETAEILIPSPFTGEHWAWVTVERDGVLSQEIVHLDSNSFVYQLPIESQYAPNIFVSVVLVTGPSATEPTANHKVGYVMLEVEPVDRQIHLALTPDPERAEPGDTITIDVEALDANGAPVQGQFSIDVVDKSVLSLRPRNPDAIIDTFYGERGLGVQTASGLAISLDRLLLEQMEDLEPQALARGARDMGGGEAGLVAEEAAAEPEPAATMTLGATDNAEKAVGSSAPAIELREDFADTAFWAPAVATDEDGRASINVELPDNLTTWVLRGVGVTDDTKVGEETRELLVTKPLLVRPVAPRFFVVDDRVELAAMVSNNTGSEQIVEVTLNATGLTLNGPATQEVTMPAGSESRVTWWTRANDTEVVDLTILAAAGEHSDAARPRLTTGPNGTLLVHRYSAPEIVGTGGQLAEAGSRSEVVALPPKYDDQRGELSVRLDPSLAAGMIEGLSYLEHYPYECTEQTVSRFLPNLLTYQALNDLGLSNPELEAKLPTLVGEGIERLSLQQNGDGGWGWWYRPEGESNPQVSAYAVFGLAKAQEAGFVVDADVLQRGLDYLNSTLVRARQLKTYREANQQAFILYVLVEAGQETPADQYVDDLYRRRERLNHYARAFLALTLSEIDEDDRRIATLLSDLQNAAILSATGAHWEETDYDWWAMNTDTRSTAVVLDALARLDPENALIPQVVRWLMVARRDGIWETTQETAWALIALTDWMVVTGELGGDYEYGVWLNNERLASDGVNEENIDESVQLQIAVAELLAEGSNHLTIERGTGNGRLYYTAHLKVFLPVAEIKPLNRGIIVSRHYSDPACAEGLRCPEVTQAEVGDIIQVHLTIIAPHDLHYVVIEDPLPAGGEGIDPQLATTSLLTQDPSLVRETEGEFWHGLYRWWWRWYSRSEMRDDRVVLFADHMPAGTYEYSYAFRATQAGEYHVIPTTAQEFYFPEVFGRGAGQLFTIASDE